MMLWREVGSNHNSHLCPTKPSGPGETQEPIGHSSCAPQKVRRSALTAALHPSELQEKESRWKSKIPKTPHGVRKKKSTYRTLRQSEPGF